MKLYVTEHCIERMRQRMPSMAQSDRDRIIRIVFAMVHNGHEFGGQIGNEKAVCSKCRWTGDQVVFPLSYNPDHRSWTVKTALTFDQAVGNVQMRRIKPDPTKRQKIRRVKHYRVQEEDPDVEEHACELDAALNV